MLNFRPGCSSVGSDRLQMDSNLQRMFRPWPMPSSSWRVPTSSTDRLETGPFSIALPMLVLALVDPTLSRSTVFQVLMTLLSFDLPLCRTLLPRLWSAFLLMMPLTAGNETFPLPVARCSCFQWCLVSVTLCMVHCNSDVCWVPQRYYQGAFAYLELFHHRGYW